MPECGSGGWDGRSIVMIRLTGMVVVDFGHEGWGDEKGEGSGSLVLVVMVWCTVLCEKVSRI